MGLGSRSAFSGSERPGEGPRRREGFVFLGRRSLKRDSPSSWLLPLRKDLFLGEFLRLLQEGRLVGPREEGGSSSARAQRPTTCSGYEVHGAPPPPSRTSPPQTRSSMTNEQVMAKGDWVGFRCVSSDLDGAMSLLFVILGWNN